MPSRLWSTSLVIALSLLPIGEAFAQNSTAPAAASANGKDANATPAEKPSAPANNSTVRGDKAASPGETTKPSRPKFEKATFGAGCFWHVEAVFERLPGVQSAVSGYSGGNVPYPNYEMVHEGITGHAEVVQVTYDPEIISYEDLLKAFWQHHDPTTLNRQGEDVGTQYRSIIFYHNRDQREAALKSYRQLTQAGVYGSPIVTDLQPMRQFFRAEDEHQDFYGGKPAASTRRGKAATAKAKKAPARAKGSSTTVPSVKTRADARDQSNP